jgi:hypothetical protein
VGGRVGERAGAGTHEQVTAMTMVLTILTGLAMLATLGVLVAGVLGMAGGSGNSERSQKLMRWRIILQFVALALFGLLLLTWNR